MRARRSGVLSATGWPQDLRALVVADQSDASKFFVLAGQHRIQALKQIYTEKQKVIKGYMTVLYPTTPAVVLAKLGGRNLVTSASFAERTIDRLKRAEFELKSLHQDLNQRLQEAGGKGMSFTEFLTQMFNMAEGVATEINSLLELHSNTRKLL